MERMQSTSTPASSPRATRALRAESLLSRAALGAALLLGLQLGGVHARAQPAPTATQTPASQASASASQPRPGGAGPSQDALRNGSPPQLGAGLTEPDLWPAADAEGWAKPVLIRWQRSFEDALRIARETNKPILVAVNMDGEIASEHYAGVRYRDPESARLFEPYVCIAASVYRHTPRDHDAQGQRVVCPRLGSMTCGEHIQAEVDLYDKYFDGVRVSPRHLVLEPDGARTSDVYYAWDTASVLTSIRKGAENRPPPRERPQGDRPLAERASSRDSLDRDQLETHYVQGDREQRRALLQAVLAQRVTDQIDLLRIAIFGLDLELARLARQALAQSESEAAVDLIAEALKIPLPEDERALLVAASDRLAAKYPRARTLTAVHQGLGQQSRWIDLQSASKSQYEARSAAADARAATDLGASLNARASAAESQPADADAQLALAESLLARARAPATKPSFAPLLVEDARASLSAAQQLLAGRADEAQRWRLAAVSAVLASWSGDQQAARAHAVEAVEGGMLRPDPNARSLLEETQVAVVGLFAQARQSAIRNAYRARESWPPEWLADINAAYVFLAQHPLSSAEHLISLHDFLRWIGAGLRANAVLDAALARFPDSALVHERLRAKALWESGPEGLEAAYSALLSGLGASRGLERHAGYASLVAAEHQRRAGDLEAALAAYTRAIEAYERYFEAQPDARIETDHYVAIGLAGRARIALERGDLALATSELVACFTRSPNSAASPDGLNITPVETSRQLRSQLEAAGHAEWLAQLQGSLAALDPALLEKRAYELEEPVPNSRRNRAATPGAAGSARNAQPQGTGARPDAPN